MIKVCCSYMFWKCMYFILFSLFCSCPCLHALFPWCTISSHRQCALIWDLWGTKTQQLTNSLPMPFVSSFSRHTFLAIPEWLLLLTFFLADGLSRVPFLSLSACVLKLRTLPGRSLEPSRRLDGGWWQHGAGEDNQKWHSKACTCKQKNQTCENNYLFVIEKRLKQRVWKHKGCNKWV